MDVSKNSEIHWFDQNLKQALISIEPNLSVSLRRKQAAVQIYNTFWISGVGFMRVC